MDRWGGTSDGPGLIPLERELRERLNWFVRLRWLAALGIVVGAWAVSTFILVDLSPLIPYVIGVVVALYNVLFLVLTRRLPVRQTGNGTYRTLTYAQMALDWLALICLVHYSGGVHGPVPLAFSFHLIIGALLLSRRACCVQTLLAMLLLGGLIVAERSGWWPPVQIDDLPFDASFTAPECLFRWLTLSLFLIITAFLTSAIAVPLRRKEEALFASKRALDRANSDMEALYELGQVVNGTLDLGEVLGNIVRSGAQLLNMKACSIRLLEEDGKHLRIGATFGLSEAYLDKGLVEVARSGVDAEVLRGKTVQIRDVTTDSRFQYTDEARREGLHGLLCVPLQAKGKVIGCMRVYSDKPREFIHKEESLLNNLANLGAVAIENVRSYAAVQSASDDRAWFARMTHHQLRAPLAAARSMLDALRYAGELTEKQTDLVIRSRRRVDELLGMIRDLLDLAAAQRPLDGQAGVRVALAECLADVTSAAKDTAEHKQVELVVDLAPEATVIADPGDVERIFGNLLDNAVKYTPSGGRVSLTGRRSGEVLEVTVQDSGMGIDAGDQERIFQGFFRTEAAKASGQMGTGMGLSIVARLVERWGGRIELESALGAGSLFRVQLPAPSP